MTNLYRAAPGRRALFLPVRGQSPGARQFPGERRLAQRRGVQFDAVHINAEQLAGNRATDHDPSVGRFFIEAPNAAPTDLVIDDNEVAENAPAGTVVGTLSATTSIPRTS
jgi:hypothetical protein